MANSDLKVREFYDALAPDYEHQLAQNPVAEYMRAQLHRHFARVFKPGDRVLDLGAGTGIDACFLASRGIRVIAIDASPGMIKQLEGAADRQGLTIEAYVLPLERLRELELRSINGAITSFGGLNAVAEIPKLARELATLVKPRGHIVLHALSDFCLWHTARLLVKGRVEIHRRGSVRPNGKLINHRFYSPLTLWRDSFKEDFYCADLYALSVLAAPPLVRRFRQFAPALFAIDRIAGRLLPTAGDFFVMDLVRRG